MSVRFAPGDLVFMPIQRDWAKPKPGKPLPIIPMLNSQCGARAKKNHGGQSLDTLADRGGLSFRECFAILSNIDYDSVTSEDVDIEFNVRMYADYMYTLLNEGLE